MNLDALTPSRLFNREIPSNPKTQVLFPQLFNELECSCLLVRLLSPFASGLTVRKAGKRRDHFGVRDLA
ncbi:MAG: hypothetical protein WA624_16655, partial [Methylocella sp.]